jgi:tetratricopeptide (TPR) repeat protein
VAALRAERAAVLRSLARSDEAIDDYRQAVSIYETLGDSEAGGRVSVELAWALLWCGNGLAAREVSDRALARLTMGATRIRARLLFCKALAIGATPLQSAFDALDEGVALARDDEQIQAEGRLFETHICWASMQLTRARELARALAAAAEAAHNDYAYAEAKWMEIGADPHLGARRDIARSLAELKPRAERVGHHNVAWITRNLLAVVRMREGVLEEARELAAAAHEFGTTHGIAWRFFDSILLGLIALSRGDVNGAVSLLRRGIDEQPSTYWSGVCETYLFHALTVAGDDESRQWLQRLPQMPSPGELASSGSWFSVTPLVRAWALLERHDEVAALRPATEALLASGLCGYFWDSVTTAAIATSAGGDWARAEELHRRAIDQVDTLPMVCARPDAREWYARMLLARHGPGDADRARSLLDEAIVGYEAMGMRGFADRAARRRI